MRFKLDKETIKKIRSVRRAERAFRKLSDERRELTPQQRASLKGVMAKGMRSCPTKAESRLRNHLAGLGFIHNKVVFGFIPDFTNERARIIIEVDGPVHMKEEVQARDRRKDAAFTQHGWTVVRVSNEDVMQRIEGVMKEIHRAIGNDLP
jgi:very-short-patch-repair endonuclease